ncbi:MAG: LamG domain-containing protein [Myxococcales bacterium]|nr:LamG domain-containing protein [Myxococcales bacterium]
MKRLVLAVAWVVLWSAPAGAVTSTISIGSAFSGNGHNASFDGRIYIVRDHQGWRVMVLRPEAATYRSDGLPDAAGPLWSPRFDLLMGTTIVENALAICEPDRARAPYRCNDAGAAAAQGAYHCYDFWLIDSDAETKPQQGGAILRRRRLQLWIADPQTASARVHKATLGTATPLAPQLRGIEPTVTADGKLLVWQGHPQNDGTIDVLMYAVNQTPCGVSGWSTPHSLSHMAYDAAVIGKYRLAERPLRASDGSVFADGALVHGAYPWLMPDGSAVMLDASQLPCITQDNPPGCGPRRNSFAVLGYPTNWGIAIVDGGVNPDTDLTARLFFSSPGPKAFTQLPVTQALDVWPLFGSNTANYVELVFDDGLDGKYAGYWHFNENVRPDGSLDLTRVPDVSGYFNTGTLKGGLSVSKRNNGVIGRALQFDGVDDRVEVPHSATLTPVNGITIDFWIRPSDPNCDANNNYRVVVSKGGFGPGGSYSVVLEDNAALQVRFGVNGAQQSLITPALPLDKWSHVSCEYDGPSGQAGCWVDDKLVVDVAMPKGTLDQSSAPLLIGAPGARAACPNGDGAFKGLLDELSISRVARRRGTSQPPPPAPDGGVAGDGPSAQRDAVVPAGDGSVAGDGAAARDARAATNDGASAAGDGNGSADDSGCGCRTTGSAGGAPWGLLLIALLLWQRRRRRRRRRWR